MIGIMDGWKIGGMEDRKIGGMEDWKIGGIIEDWKDRRMGRFIGR